jgi:adenosylcobinamide-GDP ribazoletransferase
MKEIFYELLLAFQFMTRIPISGLPYRSGALAGAAKFFPVVGLAIGLMAAAIHHLLAAHLERQLLAMVLLVFLILITGGLHEDGLADSADAFGGGRSKEQILSIMRDSRIGSYGAIAVTVSLLARFILLSNIASVRLPGVLIAASVLCRWTSLPLGFLLPYAQKDNGLGGHVAGRLRLSSVAWATLFAVGGVAAGLGRDSLGPWLTTILLTAVSALYFKMRIGGITGDCFGAANQITEIAIYFYGALRS